MNQLENLGETPWRAIFRINHGNAYLAKTLENSSVLADKHAAAVDRDIHLTDLVFRVCSDDSSKLLGRAAVILWDTLDAEAVQSPVIEAAIISDGDEMVFDCTPDYEQLRNERLSLLDL